MQRIVKVLETDAGVEVPAITASQMRDLDRIAVEETGPNLYQMMENAGRNLAHLVLEFLASRWCQSEVVVLAGPGGNGGGGLSAARHLANRGVDVRVCFSEPNRLSEAAAFQLKILRSTGAREVDIAELQNDRPGMIVDALIGYGFEGPPRGAAVDLIRWANGTQAPILSLDVPSGLDATTGEVPGEVIRPTWTLTLALPKTGLARGATGELFLADIGIPQAVFRRIGISYHHPFDQRFVVPLRYREEQ